MKCSSCTRWSHCDAVRYGDGSTVVVRESADKVGLCNLLVQETAADFGCVSFNAEDDDDVGRTRVETKPGAPWQHFVMIDCPVCKGGTDGCGGNCQCAGTGKVRRYDDGHVGEERTRLHPKEKELLAKGKPTCRRCQMEMEAGWVCCPSCMEPAYIPMAKTEVIEGLGNQGDVR